MFAFVKEFKLEPKVRGLEVAERKIESLVKEELSAVKKADRFRELTNLYGKKKARNEVSPPPLLPLGFIMQLIVRCIWDFNWHLMKLISYSL